ncbi:MAG: TonB-dependent receptor [Acidobacteria bacterium]|nr:TonB-dependent receptor [Acidobacteriota bacterium]
MLRNRLMVSLVILLFTAAIAKAQGGTGQISGTVVDQVGAVISGASVKVTNSGTNFSRETTTNGDGQYSVSLLPAGSYTVSITATNFKTSSISAVVNISQTTTVDANLSVGGAGDFTVDVVAPTIQVETSQNGRTVSGDTIRQLPLPSRNFQQLLALSPGAQSSVTNSTDLGRGDAVISVNGQRTTSNSVKINGIDANSIGTNSTPNIAVPATDSLQEFIVQTSLYDASNGRNSGGSIEAVTRSGTNDLHGNAYYFLRNKALNANEPFIKARGLERPVATRNQFGGTLGGPVVKDRVFFFGAYQGTREKNGVSLTNSLTSPAVPLGLTDSNRTAAGILATFGVTPNQVALNILNARLADGSYAIPSSGTTARPVGCPAATLIQNCAVTVPQSGVSEFRENQFSINGDFIITNKHNLAAKIFYADNPTTQANYNFAGSGNGERQLIGFGGDLTIKQKLYSVTDTYVFSPNVVNQARYGFNRLVVTSFPDEPFTAAQLGIGSSLSSRFPGAPTIRVLGADSAFFFGSGTLADQSSRISAHTFGDTLSVTKGNHRMRFGAEYRQSTVKFYFNAFSRGQLLFGSFTNFLLGAGTSLLGSGVFDRSFRVKDLNGFAQDDWKVNSRLTLNLGVRYDYYGLPSEEFGRLVNFFPDSAVIGTTAAPAPPPNGFVQAAGGSLAGVPTVTETLVPTDKNNISPRIGFAFAARPDLVVRGGYGLYYDRISTRYANTQLFNYPYFALGVGLPGLTTTFASPFVNMPLPSSFPTATTIPSPISGIAPFVGVPIAGVFVDPNLDTPYIHQYNFGVQWQIKGNYVLDVGYVGNKGRHLFQVVTLNQPTYNPSTNAFTTRFPTSIISGNKNATGGIQQVQTTSKSTYDSLQISLSKRFSNGLQFLAAHTKGESIDFYSGGALNEVTNMAGDQVNWQLNRGPSDFNRTDRFVLSGVYAFKKRNYDSGFLRGLLNDWQVASILVLQTGLPFSITADNGTTIIQRANLAPGYNGNFYTMGSMSTRTNAYFNTGAFVTSCLNAACSAAVGAVTNPNFDPGAPFGNTARNFLVGPGQKNLDISFIKMIPFSERVRGEFRTELFNAFNFVNYANPNNNLIGANFGRIERASTGPRVIQLAFKLSF